MKPKKSKNEVKAIDKLNRKRTLIFDIKDEKYGIDVSFAQSVFEGKYVNTIPDSQTQSAFEGMYVHPVPNTPDFVYGIINDRGILKPIIDIRKIFGLDGKLGNLIITLIVENIPFGIMADRVEGVVELDFSKLQPAPHSLEKTEIEYVVGVISYLKKDVLTILDIVKIMRTAKDRLLKY